MNLAKVEALLDRDHELVLFQVVPEKWESYGGQFGVGRYNEQETQPHALDIPDCEYGNSLEEALDKAIERWGK